MEQLIPRTAGTTSWFEDQKVAHAKTRVCSEKLLGRRGRAIIARRSWRNFGCVGTPRRARVYPCVGREGSRRRPKAFPFLGDQQRALPTGCSFRQPEAHRDRLD